MQGLSIIYLIFFVSSIQIWSCVMCFTWRWKRWHFVCFEAFCSMLSFSMSTGTAEKTEIYLVQEEALKRGVLYKEDKHARRLSTLPVFTNTSNAWTDQNRVRVDLEKIALSHSSSTINNLLHTGLLEEETLPSVVNSCSEIVSGMNWWKTIPTPWPTDQRLT